MSMLAIDIETASPHSTPRGDMQNTDHFELVAVGLGYQNRPGGTIESDVLFRDGDWELYHTTELLSRVEQWIKSHNPNYALTYNGSNFDATHLLNWAQQADEEYKTTTFTDTFETVFDNHIDLIRPASSVLEGSGSSYLSLDDALTAADIETQNTYYSKYNLPTEFTQQFETQYVQNSDVGRVLGETYVEHIATPTTPTAAYTDVESLLYDYTVSDIEPLFELSESLRQTL